MAVTDHDTSASPPVAGYWQEARQPVVCLVFIAPMLAAYEGGVLVLGPQAMRNGVDVYLRHLLEAIGFGQYFLLPLLAGGILLAWQHMTGRPWRVRPAVLVGMLAESSVLAMVLLLLARAPAAFSACTAASCPAVAAPPASVPWFGQLLSYFGAGIYEELLFRLILLPPSIALAGYLGAGPRGRVVAGVLFTSFLFAAAHYQWFTFNGDADLFQWYSFLFRLLAGAFFAGLFLCRGFGVTAGAHALYDIFVQLL